MQERPIRVVIVGGGAAGVLAAVALAAVANIASIVVVERADRIGPGLAYGRAEPHHLLNSLAGRMGAVDADPLHFVRWSEARGQAIGAHDFAPRRTYGDYLAETFQALVHDSRGRVQSLRGDVTAVRPSRDGALIRLADGTSLDADALVLAIGNPPPAARDDGTWIDPWTPGALDGIDGDDRVLLIGTGLTAVDAATTLARRGVRVVATSRSLLLPRAHSEHHSTPGPGLPAADGLDAVVAAFGQRLRIARGEGRTWQSEVDGVRPQVNAIWAALCLADRRRFVAHFARRWEVHRHRMAPTVAAEIEVLRADGAVRLASAADPGAFDVVVDCTGPRPAAAPGWSGVVTDLLAAGHARPDALGIGLDVAASGAVRDATGRTSTRLFALGTVRRGSQWESTAVPEIRAHAQAIAAALGGADSAAR